MKLEKFGKVRILAGGKEYAYLTFYDGFKKKLSVGMCVYGDNPTELIFEPYKFRELDDEINALFLMNWEQFMLDLAETLRGQGYIIDIWGLVKTPEGRILKDPDYAKTPKPFDPETFLRSPNVLFSQAVSQKSELAQLVKIAAGVLFVGLFLVGVAVLS